MKCQGFMNLESEYYMIVKVIFVKGNNSIMNIEATKLELMQLLLQTQKVSLLLKIKALLDEEQEDWWSEMSKSEQEEIETGLAQANKDEVITNEEVMKRFDKWH